MLLVIGKLLVPALVQVELAEKIVQADGLQGRRKLGRVELITADG